MASKDRGPALFGAPYLCGVASAEALRALTVNTPVLCKGSAKEMYGRLIGVCYAREINLTAEMVRKGWPLGYERY